MSQFDYKYGRRNIPYKANNFVTGVTVTARVWDPSMIEVPGSPFSLTEVDDGLYYLNFNFRNHGIWSFIFYENGTQEKFQALRVGTKVAS